MPTELDKRLRSIASADDHWSRRGALTRAMLSALKIGVDALEARTPAPATKKARRK
jgi:hypothetical protein